MSSNADGRSLATRLAEAEATIQALMSGQIDAVVDLKTHTPILLAKAQAALRDERDHAQRCLDTPDVILLALDLAGRITLVNRYACAVLGWSSTDLLGKNWAETCLPLRARRGISGVAEAGIGGDLAIGESSILTKSGEERLIEWRNTVIRDRDGQPVGTFSSGADITERDRAAQAVRTAEERMRFVLESAGVGIWDWDFVTGELQWSATLEKQYGLAVGDAPRTYEAFVDLIHPEDRVAVLETVNKAMKTGADFVVIHRITRADGNVLWLSGAGRIFLGPDGQAIRGVGTSQDVTGQRALEQQFHHAQKMEAIGRLAGGVAHDFNNLLTIILGFCELVIDDLALDDRRRKDVAEIQKAGLSATRLTGQLLAFSRKEIVEPRVLDLNEVVVNMRGMLARLIGEDVPMLLNLWPDRVLVWADLGHVEQVIMNLSVNARDAMPTGGTLTIATTLVDAKEAGLVEKHGRYATISVQDTGCGLSPEVKARLFEPFFTTKPVGLGTGLGLATVHGIVNRNNGTITVESEVGRGTTFTVFVPEAHGAAEFGVVTKGHAPRGSETVLVVEDADGLRTLTKKMLERQGYVVHVAASAEHANRLFAADTSIDVVLSDVVMPGTSGPELIEQLRARRPGVKVVYMSGYTDDAIVRHGVLKAGIAFLHKPFTGETLGRKIRAVLDAS